jgi:hypothetical protein
MWQIWLSCCSDLRFRHRSGPVRGGNLVVETRREVDGNIYVLRDLAQHVAASGEGIGVTNELVLLSRDSATDPAPYRFRGLEVARVSLEMTGKNGPEVIGLSLAEVSCRIGL